MNLLRKLKTWVKASPVQIGLAGLLIAGTIWGNGWVQAAARIVLENGSGTEIGTAGNPIYTSGGSGAPTTADYLVGTANGSLSAEIVVGTSPGGELGNTWASPTIDDGVTVANWSLTDAVATGSFNIPNAAAPTVDAFGEIAGDNNLWGASRGAPVWYDGTATVGLVGVLTTDTCANGEVVKFNTGGTWTCETDSTGGTTAWSAIGDAAADGSVDFVATEQDIVGQLDSANKSMLTITDQDADVAADTTILTLAHNDGADANAFYEQFINDADGTPTAPWTVSQTAFTTSIPATISGGLNSSGGTTTLGVVAGAVDAGGATSVEIPNGTGPTVDAAGEIAVDTTDDQLIYYGAAKRVMPYTYRAPFRMELPTGNDDNVVLPPFPDAVTVTRVYCITQGGTSVGITFSDGTNAFEEVVCDSDGQADDGSITNATFTADERLEYDTGTVTGAVQWVAGYLEYTVTAQ